jgi:rhodanese-related sulfurtransferase
LLHLRAIADSCCLHHFQVLRKTFFLSRIYSTLPAIFATDSIRSRSIIKNIVDKCSFVETTRERKKMKLFRFFFAFLDRSRVITRFLNKKTAQNTLPNVSERSLIAEVITSYPALPSFLQLRYAITIDWRDHTRSFAQFARARSLPPAQILFMEFQLSERTKVRGISARDLHARLQTDKPLIVLDVRENWEHSWGTLPGAQTLDSTLLSEAVTRWPKNTPIAVVCHFGVRSLDAAIYLGDQGFEEVWALNGGLEAWSLEADPTFPRYPGHPC